MSNKLCAYIIIY